MKPNHQKQSRQRIQRQPGLQFKTTRKRTNRRPVRSKSSISSKDFHNQNNYQLISCTENKHDETDCMQEVTNLGQFDFGKNKEKNTYIEDQYSARAVMRTNNFPPIQKSKDKVSIIQAQDTPLVQNFSNNSISVWGQPQNNQIQFRYTSRELNKNCFRSNLNTTNHIRNRTQTYDHPESVTPHHERANNFWSSRKNHKINTFSSIHQEIIQPFELKISNFQLGLCSSQDIFGKLYPARHLPSGFIVCLKIINKREVHHDLDRFIECLKIQSYHNKQYIVDIYGIFEENDRIYVVMQYHTQGMLFMKMKSQVKMTTKGYLTYFQNICSAVRDLHSVNIVYRNFKPENISLFHDTCKISNLCWSSRVQNQKNNYSGTIQYCSPELAVGSKYNKQSDIWALGVLLYELAVGVTPCYNLSRRQALDRIIHGQFEMEGKVNSQLVRILEMAFMKDPQLRMTIEQLIQEIEGSQQRLACESAA